MTTTDLSITLVLTVGQRLANQQAQTYTLETFVHPGSAANVSETISAHTVLESAIDLLIVSMVLTDQTRSVVDTIASLFSVEGVNELKLQTSPCITVAPPDHHYQSR